MARCTSSARRWRSCFTPANVNQTPSASGFQRLACQGAHTGSGRLLRLDSQRAENPKRNHGYYGHKTSKEIVRYTQGAQQQLLARNAFGKGHQLTTIVSHRSRMAIVGHLNQRKALKMLPNL